MTPQQTIQALLDELVSTGKEWGAQVTAYMDGKLVADAFAGIANPATGTLVIADTLFPVFSTTKGIAATMVHRLAERGLLEYDRPVADYWPEFGAHGKGGITLRHALNHTAGLPFMPRGITHGDLGDWDKMCAAIADLEPSSPPGAQMSYHAVTYSWTVGEAACRVTGRSFNELVQEEVCAPLGITDLFVGLPDTLQSGVAILGDAAAAPTGNPPPADDDTPQAVPALMQPLHEWMNRPDMRRACIPASNGIMTARAIARHYAALLPGGLDGVELLPAARAQAATQRQYPSNPRKGDAPMNQALGYQLGFYASVPGAFGHGGYGGSMGFADPESRLAIGFTRNYFAHPSPVERIVSALLGMRER